MAQRQFMTFRRNNVGLESLGFFPCMAQVQPMPNKELLLKTVRMSKEVLSPPSTTVLWCLLSWPNLSPPPCESNRRNNKRACFPHVAEKGLEKGQPRKKKGNWKLEAKKH